MSALKSNPIRILGLWDVPEQCYPVWRKGSKGRQVGIVGCSDSWRFYSDGVLDYGDRKLNHCVQLVGYDTSANPPYW